MLWLVNWLGRWVFRLRHAWVLGAMRNHKLDHPQYVAIEDKGEHVQVLVKMKGRLGNLLHKEEMDALNQVLSLAPKQ